MHAPADDRHRTVLLVEDDALIRSSVAEMLQEHGHIVIDAGSAEEAMAALSTAPIDVLVTDMNLPGASGTDLAARARALRPGVRVVYATGEHRRRRRRPGGAGARQAVRHRRAAARGRRHRGGTPAGGGDRLIAAQAPARSFAAATPLQSRSPSTRQRSLPSAPYRIDVGRLAVTAGSQRIEASV